ncbi:uncharacterized protein LOC144102309 [Amblyomma americanum]
MWVPPASSLEESPAGVRCLLEAILQPCDPTSCNRSDGLILQLMTQRARPDLFLLMARRARLGPAISIAAFGVMASPALGSGTPASKKRLQGRVPCAPEVQSSCGCHLLLAGRKPGRSSVSFGSHPPPCDPTSRNRSDGLILRLMTQRARPDPSDILWDTTTCADNGDLVPTASEVQSSCGCDRRNGFLARRKPGVPPHG